MRDPASHLTQEGRVIARKRLGRILLLVGILAWAPYAVLHYLMGLEIPVWPFLTVHLMGVIPGSILSRWNAIRGWLLEDGRPRGLPRE